MRIRPIAFLNAAAAIAFAGALATSVMPATPVAIETAAPDQAAPQTPQPGLHRRRGVCDVP